ncbi:pyruvate carboxylase [Pediococcus claussenii]|uniref:Pyruvate carboxylase n=1 Tax=Pediococcus claussenii (strain ATCC BAA-344 / DSM 14800 / JCM 18046 / KCTC 3811 / LMG 21948 / P06) TaxID=701521 RepID=G8PEE3_PEDCP|nr:pyruvate carboxylase [Pediococcus claussenii]AEV94404.1 pyruvate carboxylase [Pediococcus claussenii ATCC BAA-344]ANZ69625.1 pyruvate carboxylase [Pediococcus claussenii]ANZ71442.1 pyruvate carboxylase [Pediococcus claussenii]KRN19892.1 pyc protein [Pediococcus claussenii]
MQRILIANRGEIATRIIRAIHELHMTAIAIYSKEDEFSMHRFKADEAYLVGEGDSPIDAYLDIEDIIRIAKEQQIDAIHPGYGFLSENADFAQAVTDAGIKFIGPSPELLEMFGDKIKAKQAAIKAGVPTIPGTKEPVEDVETALAFAEQFGYPIFVKSAAGGGGKGMRVVNHPQEMREAFQMAQSEAEKSFGDDETYLERYLKEPIHIEVQIIADEHGEIMHLFERNSSVQRRHQKMIEFAPAIQINEKLRQAIQQAAVHLLQSVDYYNAATVEFLVDGDNFYFMEVNPRVQVEHTVTEEVTGVDIVQTQIRISNGERLHEEIGIPRQEDLKAVGVAIQARITTEDPMNNFVPDVGRIQTYRSPGGNGVRLDAGNAFTGAYITPYYDSLLTKAIVHASTFEETLIKLDRVLHEFVIRGVKTNLPFLIKLIHNPVFRSGQASTIFVDETPELFDLKPELHGITKLMDYIANTTVNGYPGLNIESENFRHIKTVHPQFTKTDKKLISAKQILDQNGPDELSNWVKKQRKVLLTDTTMRDAHQSLFATRLRTKDIVDVAGEIQKGLPDLFSVEAWGGATFDVAYRFLGEDPWERLRKIRKLMPDTMIQMLLRGSNAVGYQNYPDNVIDNFIDLAAKNGVDVFRIFDSLNWVPQMEESIKQVRDVGKVAEAAMAYTGDVLDTDKNKYNIKYYVDLARELQAEGAHIIGIKDMAGILKPQAAYRLISELKNAVEIPIHLHTHDTTGNGILTYSEAVRAGVDIVDVASSSFAGTTSQPSMTSLFYGLEGSERQPDLDVEKAEKIDEYWNDVRPYYESFGKQLNGPQTEIYRIEMPGGQYTNLRQQANALRLGDRWDDIKQAYATVNQMFGDITKVTPSSKVVGDMALFMVQNNLTEEQVYSEGNHLDFPESVVDFFKGDLGQPVGGFPEKLQKLVLKGQPAISVRPGSLAEPADFDKWNSKTSKLLNREATPEEVISNILYPDVFSDYVQRIKQFGPMTLLDTPTFFAGMRVGERIDLRLGKGRSVIIVLREISQPNDDGQRSLFFEVNGQAEEVVVQDMNASVTNERAKKAEPTNKDQIGATMPGSVVEVLVEKGQMVHKGDNLIVTEAMKMETMIHAPFDAKVKHIYASSGMQIENGDLLVELVRI